MPVRRQSIFAQAAKRLRQDFEDLGIIPHSSLGVIACIVTVTSCAPSPPDARSLLLEARATATSASDSAHPMGPEIAWWLARAGANEDALATARMAPNMSWWQYETLLAIRASLGDLAGADSLAKSIIPPKHVVDVRRRLAVEAAQRGDTLGAFRIGRDLGRSDAEWIRLQSLPAMIKSGRFADAESTIARATRAGIDVGLPRADLASAYYDRGDLSNGDRIAGNLHPSEQWDLGLDKIRAVARRDWPHAIALENKRPINIRAQDLGQVASDLLQRGDTAKAAEALDSAAANALRLADHLYMLQSLADIARLQFDASLPPKAARLMALPDFAHFPTHGPYSVCMIVSAFATAHRGDDVQAVNRRNHCDRTEGAAAQFTAGDVDGAIQKLDSIGDAGQYAVLVAQWTATAAATRGVPTALHMFALLDAKRPSYDNQVAYAAAGIVRVMGRSDPARALTWARARRTAVQKTAALTALAQVLIVHADSLAGRPFRPTP